MWAGLSQLPEAVKCLGCYYLEVRIKNVGGYFHILQDLIPLEEPPTLHEGKRSRNPISPRQNKKTKKIKGI